MAGAYKPNGINEKGQIYFHSFSGRDEAQRVTMIETVGLCAEGSKKKWNKKLRTDVTK